MRLPSGGFVLLAFVGLATVAWAASSSQSAREEELAREEERSVRCDLQRVFRDNFVAFLDKIIEELAQEHFTLKQASAKVHSYCRQCYPAYLKHLPLAEEGPTIPDMIAQNLVRYFEVRASPNGNRYRPELVARLQTELQDLIRENNASATSPAAHEEPRYTVQ